MLKSLAYVVAPAYNDIEIVLMAFPTVDDATKHLIDLGLSAQADDSTWYTQATIDGESMSLESALFMEGEPADALRKALFRNGNYYGGCGECTAVEVREVPLGQPVVAFNLD